MELRVPGIGGPSPESVLGCEPNHAVTTWRSESAARSAVLHAAGTSDVHVYDWRPLTSGSRTFALWPLLLPFTLVNIAGWMGPRRGVRGWLHRWTTVVLSAALTVECVMWLTVAAVAIARTALDDEPTRAFVLGVVSATIAMAILVVGATYASNGFERYRMPSWDDEPADPQRVPGVSWRHPWGRGMTLGVDDERFYDDAGEHGWHWWIHVVLATATMATVVGLVVGTDGAASPGRALDWLIVATGIVPFGAVTVLVLVGVWPQGPRRRISSRLAGAGAAALGVFLLGGLASAAMLAVTGIGAASTAPTGPAVMLFDLYGWLALGLLFVLVATAVFGVQVPSPAERGPMGRRLLGNVTARVRSRLALTLPWGDVALASFAVAGTALAGWAAWHRWFGADDGHAWTLTESFPVAAGRWSLFALASVMIVNLVKSKADPPSLRRIGSIWDVLTFWPRSFHPFAVRPYAERAVPELREFLLHVPRSSPVVVTAHSQGSVLVVAALAPVTDAIADGEIRLVSFGSPLRDLYCRFFPSSFDVDRFGQLQGPVRWRNVFRLTDHVGRAVFRSDGDAVAELVAWQRAGAAAADVPRDLPIPDPTPTQAAVEGHNHYWASAEVVAAVGGVR